MRAVVLAAGKGKRLRPLTYTKPKCMIPVAGKPILEWVLKSLRGAGIKDVLIVVGYLKEKIIEYFGKGRRIGMDIEYVGQGEKYGTCAAVESVEEKINDTFLLIGGDIIIESDGIKKIMKEREGDITVGLKEVRCPEEYGIARVRNGFITNFFEKEKKVKKPYLANMSLYVFEPSVFKEIRKTSPSKRGEYEITDVIKKLAKKGRVKGVEIKECWLDVGSFWKILEANEFLLNKLKEKKGKIENSTVKGKVILEKGALVFDSFIEGPVYIGKNTQVGPQAYIKYATSIGDNCCVGAFTSIKNSVLMNNVNAKHLTYIGDSVIGEGCNFGAGTQIANFRFDEGSVKSRVNEKVMDTGRRKLGALIGDHTKTGVLSCIMPGKVIGDNSWIGAGVVVKEDIPRNSRVFVEQNIKILKEKKHKKE